MIDNNKLDVFFLGVGSTVLNVLESLSIGCKFFSQYDIGYLGGLMSSYNSNNMFCTNSCSCSSVLRVELFSQELNKGLCS